MFQLHFHSLVERRFDIDIENPADNRDEYDTGDETDQREAVLDEVIADAQGVEQTQQHRVCQVQRVGRVTNLLDQAVESDQGVFLE